MKVRQALAPVTPFVPIIGWLPRYERRWAGRDIAAGLAVGAVLIPQALAYAALAGMPIETGLYAAIACALLYAIFGTSREINVGPSSAVAVTVAAVVAPLADGDADRYVALAGALAILAGAALIGAGLGRLGFVADFLARPVLVGFATGLGLAIAIGQAPKLFGISVDGENSFVELWRLITSLDEADGLTMAVGFASLAALIVLGRLLPRVPAALIVVVIAIAVSSALDLAAEGVAVAGEIPSGLPEIGFPAIGLGDLSLLVPGALAVALLAYVESIAAARTFAARHDYHVNANQELIALGASNVGAGLVQSFAIDASMSRSAVADNAGVRTQVAGLVNVVLVVLTLLFLTQFFEDLPDATLAAVIIVAVAGLVDVAGFRRLYRLDRTDFLVAAAALFGVLLLGVLQGILIAVVVSLVVLVLRTYRPRVSVLGLVRQSPVEADEDYRYRSVERHPDAETYQGLVIFRFSAQLFFANARFFSDQIIKLVDSTEPNITAVIVDAGAITYIDTTAMEILGELLDELAEREVGFSMARVTGTLRDGLDRAGLIERVGEDRMFSSVRGAVTAYLDTRA